MPLEQTILKPNMVLSASECREQASVEAVAVRPSAASSTRCRRRSRGSSSSPAARPRRRPPHLNAINRKAGQAPWQFSFSYGRPLQVSALQAWRGQADYVVAGKQAFLKRARLNGAARRGEALVRILESKGILPGIKVDKGANDLAGAPGEKVTEGLDNLRPRLAEYRELGCRFAKWRAVIAIDTAKGLPSDYAIHANADALARYAALCVEQGLVPIVEPEVLVDYRTGDGTSPSTTRRPTPTPTR